MSLVGNFNIASNDRTTAQSGVVDEHHLALTESQRNVIKHKASHASSFSTRSKNGLKHKASQMSSFSTRSKDGLKHKSSRMSSSSTPASRSPYRSKSYDEKNQPLDRSTSSEEEDLEKRDKEVQDLARQYTNQSTSVPSDDSSNPFEAKEGSPLDPRSPNFKPKVWAKSLLSLTARDPDRYKGRTAGFSFRDLSVHGFGSSTDYQKSVGNVFLGAVGTVRQLIGIGQRRIEILRDLEGVVQHGELLVVLGPPGRCVQGESPKDSI